MFVTISTKSHGDITIELYVPDPSLDGLVRQYGASAVAAAALAQLERKVSDYVRGNLRGSTPLDDVVANARQITLEAPTTKIAKRAANAIGEVLSVDNASLIGAIELLTPEQLERLQAALDAKSAAA